MIIFGTRQRTVTGRILEGVEGVQCPHCGHSRFQSVGHQHYFHLYWIPTLPCGRTVDLECTHCKRALLDDEFSDELAEQVRDAVFARRSRLPMFAGSFLIAALLLFSVHAAGEQKEISAAYLATPAVGDYYVVDYTKVLDDPDVDLQENYKFSIWRLAEITDEYRRFEISDSVYLLPSGARRDIREGNAAADIDPDQEGIYVSPDELASWNAAGAFFSVQRQ